MKSKITENMGLKLISLFFAFVLWLVVNNIENPTVTETYSNIPVKLVNTNLITDGGKVYEVLDETDVVERVYVKAPKSVHSALNAGNITAVADVSELSSLDTISIEFSSDIYSNDIESITGSIDTVKLNIENKKTKTLALRATVSGSVATGYLVGDVTTQQNLVRISGPESVVNEITDAVVDVDVTGFTNDIGTNLDIRLYSEDGRMIQSDRITQNIKAVGVNVSIYQTAEVPVHYEVSGTPAAGYRVAGEPVGSLEMVTIAGKSNTVKSVTAIDVAAEEIDVTGQTEDYVTEVNLRDYLPDNVFLADATQAKAEVTVKIQRESSRDFRVKQENVEIVNVPQGFRATISELGDEAKVTVIGLPAEVSALRGADIRGTIDIRRWMEEEQMEKAVGGYYNVEVDFGLDDNFTILEPLEVVLHLSEITE